MFVAIRPWLLRSRTRVGLLLVVTLVAAVLAAVAGVTLVLVLQAPTADLRTALRGLPVASRTLEIEAAGDPSTQDRAFRGLVEREFGTVPVHVGTTVRGDTTTWTVSPDADHVTARELDALRDGFATLPAAAARRFAVDGGTTTRNAATVHADTAVLASAVAAVRAAAPIPLSIVVIAGAVALFLTGRLLVATRVAEDRLLRARGASESRIVGLAGLEGLVAGAVGAAVGSTLGTLPAAARWGVGGAATSVQVVIAAASVTLLTVAAMTVAVVWRERDADARPSDRRTRVAAARIGAVVALLDLVAGVAVWRYGSAGAAAAGDPLAVVAPAAVLAALAVTGALLLPPVLALLARIAARSTGFVRPVGLRLASRDGRRLFVPAALLVLAVSSGVLSATVDASVRGFLQDSSRIEHGAALRADVGGPLPLDGASDLLPVGVRDHRARDRGVRPVLRTTGTTGDAAQTDGSVQVVGLDAAALPAMLPVTPRTFDVARAAHGLRRSLPGVTLGGGRSAAERTLELGVQTSVASAETGGGGLYGSVTPASGTAQVEAVAWVVDGVGDIAPVTTSSGVLPIAGGPTDQTLSATLPDGGPWRLAALDLRFRGDADLSGVAVGVRSISVDHADVALPGQAWTAAPGAFDASGLRADATGAPIGVSATRLPLGSQSGGSTAIRLMPAGQRVVPVLASAATGVAVGDTLTVSGDWTSFRAQVVGSAPTVPGTDGGAAYLADLPTLDEAVLAVSQRPQRIREAWAADDGARALLVNAAPGATLTVPSTRLEAPFARSVVRALLAGTAAALFCAVLILAATAAAVARDRRDEALGLRVVGASASQQARLRALGPALTGGFGIVIGVVAGVAAAGLVGVAAVRASAPRAPAGLGVPLVPAWWDLVVVGGVAVVAVVVVTVAHASAVRRAAGRTGREAR